MSVVRGGIICESLKPGSVIEGDGMRIVRWSRYEVTNIAPYQPRVWTMIEFEAPEVASEVLADKLAAALLEPGWYANWNSEHEAVVVFPNKIFRYQRGDAAGREAAKEHGRRCGVPEAQLDWGD